MTAKSTLAIVFGGLLVLSTTAFAATTPQAPAAKHAASSTAKAATVATKVTEGTVKSVDATQLVVEHKMGGKMSDMTFKLDSATKKEGDIETGSKVTVRYRTEGADHIATTVTAHAPKPAKK
jgi:hypothetical protein